MFFAAGAGAVGLMRKRITYSTVLLSPVYGCRRRYHRPHRLVLVLVLVLVRLSRRCLAVLRLWILVRISDCVLTRHSPVLNDSEKDYLILPRRFIGPDHLFVIYPPGRPPPFN
jgi:hypothetical protein